MLLTHLISYPLCKGVTRSWLGQHLLEVKAPDALESRLSLVLPGLALHSQSYPPSSLSSRATSSRKPSWVLHISRVLSVPLKSHSLVTIFFLDRLPTLVLTELLHMVGLSVDSRSGTTRSLGPWSQSASFRSRLGH